MRTVSQRLLHVVPAAMLLTACMGPDAPAVSVFWLRFPAQVPAGQAFTLSIGYVSLDCGERGRLEWNPELNGAIDLHPRWVDFEPNDGSVYCVVGEQPLWTSLILETPVRPSGTVVPVRVAGQWYGAVLLTASTTAGTVASGWAAFSVDSLGCDRIRPGWGEAVSSAYVLGDPPPDRPAPYTRVFVTGYLETVSPAVCGADVVYRFSSPP